MKQKSGYIKPGECDSRAFLLFYSVCFSCIVYWLKAIIEYD